MAKVTPEIEEFAEIGKKVVENGVQIFISQRDGVKLFGAILAANIVAYSVIEKWKKRQASKYDSK